MMARMSEAFDAVDVIIAKRDRHELSDEQIRWVIDAYTRGAVAEEQMSSLNMAILLNGMTRREIATWTDAMIKSGERMDFFSSLRNRRRTSTPPAEWATRSPSVGPARRRLRCRRAATLRPRPGPHRRHPRQARVDCRLAGVDEQRADACPARRRRRGHLRRRHRPGPADKRLYALRDVTGTVEAIPLIASSIMSKKIAEGTGALVLDVKVGSGAFMKDLAKARELAETMVDLGTDAGVKTVALLTNMQVPLGRTAGNALEVRESVEVLAGGGPADVVELTVRLAEEMLGPLVAAAGRRRRSAGRSRDGRVAPHDRRPGWRPRRHPPGRQRRRTSSPPPPDGVLTQLDAYAVGIAAWRLGAGRARKGGPGPGRGRRGVACRRR